MSDNPHTGLKARGITLSYNGQNEVVRNVDIHILSGEFAALVGPNGSGKSTILKALAAVKRPDSGTVMVDEQDAMRMDRRTFARIVAYLPQFVPSEFDFTVGEVIAMGRYPYTGIFGLLSVSDIRWIERCMELTDTTSLAGRSFNGLSGGERQRVLLASVLAQEPRYILLDEPTVSLDLHHQASLMGILRNLVRSGHGVLMVTHDLNLASQFCDRIILIRDGVIRSEGPPEEIICELSLREIYGEGIRAFPHPHSGKPLVYLEEERGD